MPPSTYDPTSLIPTIQSPEVATTPTSNIQQDTQVFTPTPEPTVGPIPISAIEIALPLQQQPTTTVPPTTTNDHPMQTRSKTSKLQPRALHVSNSISDNTILPISVKSTLQIPHWKETMLTEYRALLYHKTWTLVE
ncbi:hypothetical protein PIB30_019089 [Stylosanthes scabra]|uniref:Uncharacterized protein n=1 Tax=Stylosanthes scabra TaxID=79078 RepID=A0ABU6U6Z9_9FABA|nr:hypothetical protein [Stylosanthes scabra]